MKLLVDTNVLLDCMLERKPFDKPASLLMFLGEIGEMDLFMSGSQVTDAYYLLTNGGKQGRANIAKRALADARKFIRIAPITEREIDAALDSTWDDIEDACVYQAARSIKANAIITRNQKDFEKSSIKVLDCEEFFTWLKEDKGVEYGEVEL